MVKFLPSNPPRRRSISSSLLARFQLLGGPVHNTQIHKLARAFCAHACYPPGLVIPLFLVITSHVFPIGIAALAFGVPILRRSLRRLCLRLFVAFAFCLVALFSLALLTAFWAPEPEYARRADARKYRTGHTLRRGSRSRPPPCRFYRRRS